MTPITHLDEILHAVRDLPPISVAVVDAEERHVLEGVLDATKAGLITPILIGQEKIIRDLWEGFSAPQPVTITTPSSGESPAECGVRLVVENQAQAIMKGWIHTDELMHPVLKHLRTGSRMSHVFVVELATYHKLLLVTDAAINIMPDLLTKAAIVHNAVRLAQILGRTIPKVAALSSVELVKPAIPSTIDAACLSKMAQRGQIPHAIIDGPLAFDNAISQEAARTKNIESPVSGDVDILLVPDLDAGNILAKDLEYLAHATLAGIVLGAKVPIILPSRSDPPRSRLVSAALAKLVFQKSWPT
ncbi:MAG: bifunctional enoyl-CoA hydratase/phosphate acetyltransferase [Nitrospirae bacterium]|nr:MAG: bifunctional enoyl-CoA hydratase/phosphate acetyltransferase [Nitrospirota bacterium]